MSHESCVACADPDREEWMIATFGLTKHFGDVHAVEDLELQIQPGELFAFLGPNGAGKTTTLKMLVGLLLPTRGRATIGGHDVQRHRIEARRITSYVPDFPFLYERLTGVEFLEFVSDVRGLAKPEAAARREALVQRLGLESCVNDLIGNYSHGLRQRLVFAAALLPNPQVLIVDEPMVGLDPITARTVKDIFRESVANGGTIFLSTHTLEVAQELAHRIGIIDKGRLIALGSLAELRERAGSSGPLEEVFLKLTLPSQDGGFPSRGAQRPAPDKRS
jgi:ABC-2 type transport system ATP-binding protein